MISLILTVTFAAKPDLAFFFERSLSSRAPSNSQAMVHLLTGDISCGIGSVACRNEESTIFKDITAKSFPYKYVQFRTPRGIANVYLTLWKYKNPLT